MIVEAPVVVALPLKDTLDHWVCCRDDNRSFCGTDVSESPWSDFDAASCVACQTVHVETGDFCPFGCGECPDD